MRWSGTERSWSSLFSKGRGININNSTSYSWSIESCTDSINTMYQVHSKYLWIYHKLLSSRRSESDFPFPFPPISPLHFTALLCSALLHAMPPRKTLRKSAETPPQPPPPAPEEIEPIASTSTSTSTSNDLQGEEEKQEQLDSSSNTTGMDRMTKMKQLRQRMVSHTTHYTSSRTNS